MGADGDGATMPALVDNDEDATCSDFFSSSSRRLNSSPSESVGGENDSTVEAEDRDENEDPASRETGAFLRRDCPEEEAAAGRDPAGAGNGGDSAADD